MSSKKLLLSAKKYNFQQFHFFCENQRTFAKSAEIKESGKIVEKIKTFSQKIAIFRAQLDEVYKNFNQHFLQFLINICEIYIKNLAKFKSES